MTSAGKKEKYHYLICGGTVYERTNISDSVFKSFEDNLLSDYFILYFLNNKSIEKLPEYLI